MEAGSLIGERYRLMRQIGEGAMGIVWEAVTPLTSRDVAIKMLRSTPDLRSRLLREAKVCGRLSHRDIIEVLDAGENEKGVPFLVMPHLHLQGATLADLVARRFRLNVTVAALIARDIARALATMHNANIIHRDMKPANIFLHQELGSDGVVVKVLDFGVSKNLSAPDGRVTIAVEKVGSPAYMSPEELNAMGNINNRTDIWRVDGDSLDFLRSVDLHTRGEPAVKVTRVAERHNRRVRLTRGTLKVLMIHDLHIGQSGHCDRIVHEPMFFGMIGTGKTSLTLNWANPLISLRRVGRARFEGDKRIMSQTRESQIAVKYISEIFDGGCEYVHPTGEVPTEMKATAMELCRSHVSAPPLSYGFKLRRAGWTEPPSRTAWFDRVFERSSCQLSELQNFSGRDWIHGSSLVCESLSNTFVIRCAEPCRTFLLIQAAVAVWAVSAYRHDKLTAPRGRERASRLQAMASMFGCYRLQRPRRLRGSRRAPSMPDVKKHNAAWSTGVCRMHLSGCLQAQTQAWGEKYHDGALVVPILSASQTRHTVQREHQRTDVGAVLEDVTYSPFS